MSDISLLSPIDVSSTLSETPKVNTASDQINKTAEDFEAVFISQMLGSMFEGEELTEYFGGGTAGDIYKSLMMNEYGKAIAKSGGIGISEQIKAELLKLQEIKK